MRRVDHATGLLNLVSTKCIHASHQYKRRAGTVCSYCLHMTSDLLIANDGLSESVSECSSSASRGTSSMVQTDFTLSQVSVWFPLTIPWAQSHSDGNTDYTGHGDHLQ